MPGIASAAITAFYLFDVAEAITLADLPEAIRRLMSEARLVPTPAIPSYVGYQQPPRVLEGAAVGIEGPAGFTSRFKVYDYGIVSVALTRPFAGSWAELIALGQEIVENEALEAQAEAACRALVERLTPVMVRPRRSFLTEDYVVFVVTALEERLSEAGVPEAERLDAVAKLLSEEGFLAEVVSDATGRHLRLAHCPLRELVEVSRPFWCSR